MIQHLYIKDYAIIDEANIKFNPGLTVITGETGSGKSLILEALTVSMGGKADKIMVRNGPPRAVIEVTFHDQQSLRRIVSNEGRTKAYINEEPTNIKTLKESNSTQIDFHGQHDQQHILNIDTHIEYLDRYCHHDDLVEKIGLVFDKIQFLKSQLILLQQSKQERADRIEYLMFQANEIDTVNPTINEDEKVEQLYKKLSHLDAIQSCLNGLQSELINGDSSISDVLEEKSRQIQGVIKYDKELGTIDELIRSAIIHLQEVNSEISVQLSSADYNPEELSKVEERYHSLEEMKRKYGGSIESVIEYRKTIKNEIKSYSDPDQSERKLKEQLRNKEKLFSNYALQLNKNRTKMARTLSDKIEEAMVELNMPGSKFEIKISQDLNESGIVPFNNQMAQGNRKGIDRIEFFLSANPGQPEKPLATIASGGEISRIMLAIKTVFQEQDPVSTLVFDEIDSGISGFTAEKVAELLLKLSKRKQVLCISHLSQIMRKADYHLNVEKIVQQNQTFVKANYLTKKESLELIENLYMGKKAVHYG